MGRLKFADGNLDRTKESKIVSLGSIVKITKGKQINKEHMIEDGTYYVLNGGVDKSGSTNDWNTDGNTISISEGGNSCGYVNYNTERFWSGGHNYTLLKPKCNVLYLYQYLKYKQSDIMRLRVGSGLPNIQLRSLQELLVEIPTIEEQEKKGGFLSAFDTLIQKQQEKIGLLKDLKKGYLQKMFPEKGGDVPEIRFKGFADIWEQCKLIDMLQQPITDGPHETPELVAEGVPFVSVDAIVENKIDFSKIRGYITEFYDEQCSNKYKPQLLDVYLVKSGSTVGKVAIVETNIRFNIWSPLAAMRTGDKSDPYFLYHLLQTKKLQNQVYDRCSHGTQPNLSMRELERFDVCIPKIEEQKRISKTLNNINDLITLHQRKLERLEELKKGYIQRLF